MPIQKRAFNNLMLKMNHEHNPWVFFTVFLVSRFYLVHQKGTVRLKPLHLELKCSKFHKTQVSLNIFWKLHGYTVHHRIPSHSARHTCLTGHNMQP